MVSIILPDDIWILSTWYMTVCDINALSCTCKRMKRLISSSKTIWKEIVEDLLSLSPNIAVSRFAPAASPAQLRSLALRYWHADYALRSRSSRLLVNMNLVNFTEFVLENHALLPGLPFIFVVSSDVSVRLVSTQTGNCVSSWRPPKDNIADKIRIDVSSSDLFILGVLVTLTGSGYRPVGIDYEDSGLLICVFGIDGPMESPKLSMLAMITSETDCEGCACAYDSKLAYWGRRSETISIMPLPSPIISTIHDPPIRKFNIPVIKRREAVQDIRFITPTILALITVNWHERYHQLLLLRTTDIDHFVSPHSSSSWNPYSIIDIGDRVDFSIGPIFPTSPARYQFIVYDDDYLFRVTIHESDPTQCTSVLINVAAHSQALVSSLQGLRACTLNDTWMVENSDGDSPSERTERGEDTDKRASFEFWALPITTVQAHTADRRLGGVPATQKVVKVSGRDGSVVPRRKLYRASYDEWSGMVVTIYYTGAAPNLAPTILYGSIADISSR